MCYLEPGKVGLPQFIGSPGRLRKFVQLDFNQQWSVDQLKDELMVLEFQGLLMRQGDSPIPLIPFKDDEELDRISEVPVWLVYLNSPKPDYYWVNRNQLISIYS